MRSWVEPAVRDDVVATVQLSAVRAGWPLGRVIGLVGIGRDRFYQWRARRGVANRHNAPLPKQGWLLAWEKVAIIDFARAHPGEGYRRLAWMMVDADVVAASPSSVRRVLKSKGLLAAPAAPSKKGTGFVQPLRPHEHWHSDVSYLNIAGTFYYFFGLIDGASRYVVHWEIRERMTEADLEVVIERAKALYPQARPRLISDNGPQYVSRDFREFVRLSGMTHVRTSPYYPQSNGKIERFHGSLKRECIRPRTPVSLDDARRLVGQFVAHYNQVRLHSAIGYVAPAAVLEGRAAAIHAARKIKLDAARLRRDAPARNSDQGALTPAATGTILTPTGETATGSAGAQPDQGITGRDFEAKSGAEPSDQGPPSAPQPFAEMLAHA
jgi:transposase InsO family protein